MTTCHCGGTLFFRMQVGFPTAATAYMICKDCVHMYRIDEEFESIIYDHGEKWDHKYAEYETGHPIYAIIVPNERKNSILDMMVNP